MAPAGLDATAIHRNINGEIFATPGVALASGLDRLLVELDPGTEKRSVAISGLRLDAGVNISTGVLADARVQQSNVTQHQAALSITESQISDLDHTDPDAVHTNVAGEIAGVAGVGTLAAGDLFLLEDIDDSNNKKNTTAQAIRDLPTSNVLDAWFPAGEYDSSTGLPRAFGQRQRIDAIHI